ncbi:MAG: potassium transporter TrkG [Synergistaceae bacterium]|nr:potassium transporter TrkG [Synergistaceae bacterium]
MKCKVVIKFLSLIAGIISLSMVFPWLLAVRCGTKDAHAFLWSLLLCAVCAGMAFFFSKDAPTSDLKTREAFAGVTLSWIVASVFGCLPFLFARCCGTFTDAFFETMSGFSTTGATIFKTVEPLPRSILLWRAETQWLGGMGIVVLAIAVSSILGGGVNSLFKAEAPGPVLQKTAPTINAMSKSLWNVYVTVTVICVILLKLGGMSVLDAVCHSFSAVSTGGFSTKTASIAYYSSPYIEYVLSAAMFVCGINFSLHLAAFSKRSLIPYKDSECVFYVKIVVCAIIAIVFFLMKDTGCKPFSAALRQAVFQVTSIITTTGFATADFDKWPSVLVLVMFLLMLSGGCAGSTAGGIKCIRIKTVWQAVKVEIKKLVHPNAIVSVRMGEQTVEDSFVASAAIFIVLYLLIFAAATMVISACEHDIRTSIGAAAATLSNIGPGFGKVGPSGNFADFTSLSKWICSLCMLSGRLELYTVLVLLSKDEWVK